MPTRDYHRHLALSETGRNLDLQAPVPIILGKTKERGVCLDPGEFEQNHCRLPFPKVEHYKVVFIVRGRCAPLSTASSPQNTPQGRRFFLAVLACKPGRSRKENGWASFSKRKRSRKVKQLLHRYPKRIWPLLPEAGYNFHFRMIWW